MRFHWFYKRTLLLRTLRPPETLRASIHAAKPVSRSDEHRLIETSAEFPKASPASAKPFILTNLQHEDDNFWPQAILDPPSRAATPQRIYLKEQPVKKSIPGVLIVLLFVAVGIAAAPPLTFTFSDVHANKSAMETDAFAVNDAGAIAGDYVDSKGVQHAMILAGKKLTTVDHKDCVTSGGFSAGAIAFYGINKTGAAAGWCTSTKTGLYQGFAYSGGKFTAVNFPKSKGTQAIGINDKGDVVGLYFDSSRVQHGFVKKCTKYTSIDVTGGTNTEAWGINNSGQITVFA